MDAIDELAGDVDVAFWYEVMLLAKNGLKIDGEKEEKKNALV